MANVIIKSDERKANTAAVLQAYGVRGNATASQREADLEEKRWLWSR